MFCFLSIYLKGNIYNQTDFIQVYIALNCLRGLFVRLPLATYSTTLLFYASYIHISYLMFYWRCLEPARYHYGLSAQQKEQYELQSRGATPQAQARWSTSFSHSVVLTQLHALTPYSKIIKKWAAKSSFKRIKIGFGLSCSTKTFPLNH